MRRVLVVAVACCLLLAGCAPTVALTPGPDATSVGCASVIVAMPQAIGTAERRNTDAQGTAAWGTPQAVTLRCGVVTPQVSELQCFRIDGVYWLFGDDESKDLRVLTSYDRVPGVQIVTVVSGPVSANDALAAVSGSIADATRSNGRKCVDRPTATATAPAPAATP